jgi:hypothetical protein
VEINTNFCGPLRVGCKESFTDALIESTHRFIEKIGYQANADGGRCIKD